MPHGSPKIQTPTHPSKRPGSYNLQEVYLDTINCCCFFRPCLIELGGSKIHFRPLILFNSRTIDAVVSSSVRLALRFVGLLIHWSYFLKEYRYTSQEQCIVSPIFYKNIYTLVKTSVSQVLLFVEQSIH